jgi:hypothetical protein
LPTAFVNCPCCSCAIYHHSVLLQIFQKIKKGAFSTKEKRLCSLNLCANYTMHVSICQGDLRIFICFLKYFTRPGVCFVNYGTFWSGIYGNSDFFTYTTVVIQRNLNKNEIFHFSDWSIDYLCIMT